MKQKNSEKNESSGDWGSVFSGFIGGLAKQWSEGIVCKVKTQIKTVVHQIQKSFVGVTIVLLGVGFFMVGISLWVNELIQKPGSWIGYSTVGMFAVITGYFIQRK